MPDRCGAAARAARLRRRASPAAPGAPRGPRPRARRAGPPLAKSMRSSDTHPGSVAQAGVRAGAENQLPNDRPRHRPRPREHRLRRGPQRRGRLLALDGGVIETAAGLAQERAWPRSTTPSRRCWRSTTRTRSRSSSSTSARTSAPPSPSDRPAARPCSPPGSARCDCFSYTPQQVKGAVCGNGARPRSRSRAWSARCSRSAGARAPTTPPTRSRWPSATPTARRSRSRWRAGAR